MDSVMLGKEWIELPLGDACHLLHWQPPYCQGTPFWRKDFFSKMEKTMQLTRRALTFIVGNGLNLFLNFMLQVLSHL